jgi:hypothetical protein
MRRGWSRSQSQGATTSIPRPEIGAERSAASQPHSSSRRGFLRPRRTHGRRRAISLQQRALNTSPRSASRSRQRRRTIGKRSATSFRRPARTTTRRSPISFQLRRQIPWKLTRNFFSTTSADYWETQQTARSADDLTNNSIEDLSDVAAITENYGDLFAWNGSAWADFATSTLAIALSDTTGTLGATRGGTGLSSITAAGILLGNYAGTGWQQLSTSTLGLLTSNVAEGSNLYYTDARVQTYLDTVAKGFFFSTTSAQHFANAGLAFSTTSTDTWKSERNFFSTTSAQYFVDASTTIPKTYSANTFSALQTFSAASTTNISATYASSTRGFFGSLSIGNLSGFLKATAGAISTALVDLANDITGVLGVANGGTGWSNVASGAVVLGNGTGSLATTSAGTNGQVLALVGGTPMWVATTTLLTISGTLAAGSGGTDITNPSAAGILIGSYAGGSWQQVATSSLNINSDNLVQGSSNLFYSNSLVQSFIHSSSTIPKTYAANSFTGANAFTALSSFTQASSSLFSVTSRLYVGDTSTTTILGSATSTFGAGLQTSYLNVTGTTATSTFARGVDLAGGCFAVNGTCVGSASGSGGGQLLAVYATSTPGTNVSVNFNGASGSSPSFSAGVLTLPSNTSYIVVEAWGAGGGGSGGHGGTGGDGGQSCFSNSSTSTACSGVSGPIMRATGGTGGIISPNNTLSGVGGTGFGGDINLTGGGGAGATTDTSGGGQYGLGGIGGSAPLGGGGGNASGYNTAGIAGAAFGGGGSGGGLANDVAGTWAGSGGGAGGYSKKLIPSPSGSYYYTLGSGGAAGASSANGGAGGPGGIAISIYTTGVSNGSLASGTAG